MKKLDLTALGDLMEKSNTDFDYKCLYNIDENTNPGENAIGKEKVKVIIEKAPEKEKKKLR